jgi:very-short-patch-repair endonuclease
MRNRRKVIWYHPDLKELARDLRNNARESEQILWQRLKGKQIQGFDFHRQKPLFYYIVDFYCHELNLAIEIDGSVHNLSEIKLKDSIR